MEICERSQQFNEELQTRMKELEDSNQLRAKQARIISKAEVNNIRQGKEDVDLMLATSNSKVDELENKVANLEFSFNQASTENESLKKDKAELLHQKDAFEEKLGHLPQQLAEAEAKAVVDFRRSQLFEENMILLQSSAMEVGQTKAIDVCSEIYPR